MGSHSHLDCNRLCVVLCAGRPLICSLCICSFVRVSDLSSELPWPTKTAHSIIVRACVYFCVHSLLFEKGQDQLLCYHLGFHLLWFVMLLNLHNNATATNAIEVNSMCH